MAVARLRCSSCRKFFPRGEVYYESGIRRVCSEDCLSLLLERTRTRARTSALSTKRPRKDNRLDLDLRRQIRARDGNLCRWCGGPGQQVHHVFYRSQGGADEPSNLILLCAEHHQQVHSNKRVWQPTLLALLWIGYVEGLWMTVPEVERTLTRQGLLQAA